MTLIIGVRCKDGVVLASDRKVLRGGEVEYSNKIFVINDVVALAVEGLTGIRDDLLYLLNIELQRRRGVDSLYEMKVLVEDIVAELSERYRDRVREEPPVGVLMAGRENLRYGSAMLYYVHGVGYGEAVEFLCTGHGGPYATSLAKFLFDKSLGVEENARRAAFVISWVAEEVDVTVGGEPDVVYVRDSVVPTDRPIERLSAEAVREMSERARRLKAELARLFFQ